MQQGTSCDAWSEWRYDMACFEQSFIVYFWSGQACKQAELEPFGL
jgi:hypothetical protein